MHAKYFNSWAENFTLEILCVTSIGHRSKIGYGFLPNCSSYCAILILLCDEC